MSSVSARKVISTVGNVRNYFQEVGSWRLSFGWQLEIILHL